MTAFNALSENSEGKWLKMVWEGLQRNDRMIDWSIDWDLTAFSAQISYIVSSANVLQFKQSKLIKK